MLKNFILIAIRNLRKKAAFSFINIFGLAIGISTCLVILNYIDFETSYDDFHTNAATLYRVNRTSVFNGERKPPIVVTTYGLGPALLTDLPEVKRYIRTTGESGVLTYQPEAGEAKAFHEDKILAADSTFFHAFTFRALAGNLATALDDPNNIVLTHTASRKYFGTADPLGRIVTLTGGRMNGPYTVAAVIEDVPPNSHFVFDILMPIHNAFLSRQYREDDGWGWNNFITYVQLHEGASFLAAELKLPDLSKRRLDPRWAHLNGHMELHLQPLRDIHLRPGMRLDVETVSRSTLYFFGLIAAFILVIAWINYINLSTARAVERAREVGIKKTIGAARGELIMQFMLESMLLNFIAIVLAAGMAVALLPVLGNIIGKALTFNFGDPRLWLTLAVLFVTGTLASGIYPAFVLSSFRITRALKARQGDGQGFSLRKALVVFQFAASLVLIAGTFVVYRQISFMQKQEKGLQMDQMLVVSGPGTLKWSEAKQRLATFKEEALKIKGVEAVATSGATPGREHNWGADVRRSGAPATEFKLGSVVWIDPDFIPTYKIPFVAGGNFDPQVRSTMKSAIINEASLAAYGLGTAEQALNEQLVLDKDTVAIAGVLKNYNWNSLKAEVTPFIFLADTIVPATLSLHLKQGAISTAVTDIGKLYKELMPADPFEYHFLDDTFNAQYKSDVRFGSIFGLFAILAVTISCLGLWGLASFTTSQKLKEIGVRKVLGASVSSIVYLLTGQFLRLVLIASALGIPLAWYGMDTWLHGFAFRIGMEWDLFVLPVTALAVITLLTVSLQVLKGAGTNPAKVLRSE